MNTALESVWILGDQLSPSHPGLAPGRRVVLIESLARLNQRPYHRRKLVLIISAMRHYAAELRAAGYEVDLRAAPDFLSGLREHITTFGIRHLICVAAAEYATRQFQRSLAAELGIAVTILPNTLFLVERYPPPRPPALMEPFYRTMRRQTGLLIEPDGEPTGGVWNLDRENRRRYDGRPVPPPVRFPPDHITRQVIADLAVACPNAIGSADHFDLAVTREQALAALDDFIAHRLPDFGPFEDAMSAEHELLFHSQLSPLLNIGLLDPLETAQAAVAAYQRGHAPLASVEGFVRQIIGWREYIYYRYWELMPDLLQANAWGAERPLPEWYWTGKTRMRCLSHVIERVLRSGYCHHIERLMVLCNFALLAGIRPQAVNDWFLECYVDAYEWVVTPNVIGMGLNADGGRTATKPYIASAAYIDKMSDYCKGCFYDCKARVGPRACPFNTLYWNFLITHEERLRANPRLGPAVLGLRRLSAAEREAIMTRSQSLLGLMGEL
ncbi:cryptochrome/photolyase family protein [Chloroflexus sp.]|uniref:cryptochrome/photolyase family protein n=1 Tax=Chloroflexus sp. TaxID=1904827 RepID=UPI00298EE9D4|nr:cryptochrome/photolyase family protein [Chloroflexus sp.]MDW8405859.1 cryptochrome/photolyase family protein [Chloroflexus sp.]